MGVVGIRQDINQKLFGALAWSDTQRRAASSTQVLSPADLGSSTEGVEKGTASLVACPGIIPSFLEVIIIIYHIIK